METTHELHSLTSQDHPVGSWWLAASTPNQNVGSGIQHSRQRKQQRSKGHTEWRFSCYAPFTHMNSNTREATGCHSLSSEARKHANAAQRASRLKRNFMHTSSGDKQLEFQKDVGVCCKFCFYLFVLQQRLNILSLRLCVVGFTVAGSAIPVMDSGCLQTLQWFTGSDTECNPAILFVILPHWFSVQLVSLYSLLLCERGATLCGS